MTPVARETVIGAQDKNFNILIIVVIIIIIITITIVIIIIRPTGLIVISIISRCLMTTIQDGKRLSWERHGTGDCLGDLGGSR